MNENAGKLMPEPAMGAPPKRAVPPSIADAAKRPEKIAVKLAYFNTPMDIPGEQVAQRIKCETITPGVTGRYWTCSFIPAIRHLEIMFFPANLADSVVVAYIHESMIKSWWPL